MSDEALNPIIHKFLRRYLQDEKSAGFIKIISEHYTVGTLERLAVNGEVTTRRSAVMALGFVGDYRSNPILGRALRDPDRAVRMLSENAIRSVWHRACGVVQRQKLHCVIRFNTSRQFSEAIESASSLIEEIPSFAEAWNQRAVAYYRLGHFDQSLSDCLQTLELNPYHFDAEVGMGQCYLERNDAFSAIACFRRALTLNPGLEGIRARVDYLRWSLRNR